MREAPEELRIAVAIVLWSEKPQSGDLGLGAICTLADLSGSMSTAGHEGGSSLGGAGWGTWKYAVLTLTHAAARVVLL